MSVNIFENSVFWSQYFLEIIGVFMLFVMSMIYFLFRNENKANLFVSISMFLLFFCLLLLVTIPKTIDMHNLLDGNIQQVTGKIGTVEEKKKNDESHIRLVVDSKEFKIKSPKMDFMKLAGEEVVVYYLEESNTVMKVVLLVKSNN